MPSHSESLRIKLTSEPWTQPDLDAPPKPKATQDPWSSLTGDYGGRWSASILQQLMDSNATTRVTNTSAQVPSSQYPSGR